MCRKKLSEWQLEENSRDGDMQSEGLKSNSDFLIKFIDVTSFNINELV